MAEFEEFESYWRDRGARDAGRDRAPIFRNTRTLGPHAVGEGTEGWTHEEEEVAALAYLAGYDAAR